jgi:hypothetical protein
MQPMPLEIQPRGLTQSYVTENVTNAHHMRKDVNFTGSKRLVNRFARCNNPMISAGSFVMFIIIVAAAAIVIGGVLWIRPWIDDHSHPYD